MNWNEVLKRAAQSVGGRGIAELDRVIGNLENEAKEPWKKALLNAAGEALSKYGLAGLDRVEAVLYQMDCGKDPDLSFLSLEARSDCLAALQNMEADDKKRSKDFFRMVGKQLGVILGAILSGLAG